VTCHQPTQGFSLVVPFIRERFASSQGRDPLFRANDTTDRPDADLSTVEARREAFALLLSLGVIRIGKILPSAPDFAVVSQDTARFGPLPNPNDPQNPTAPTLSLFRRPLATTNMRLDGAVQWDGRHSIHNLRGQVQATAQTLLLGPHVSDAQADDVATFMTSVFTAQDVDFRAGSLSAAGAQGGAEHWATLATSASAPCVPMTDPAQAQTFVPDVSPPATACVPVDPANPVGCTLFGAWENLPVSAERREARMAIARGERIFNERTMPIPGFPINHCSSCHVTTDVGNFPLAAPPPEADFFIRLGLDSPDFLARLAAVAPRLTRFVRRTQDLPVYAVAGAACASAVLPDPATGQPVAGTNLRTTDPGRAMVSGHCAELGGFKPPSLRGLAARAPFCHNGSAATLDDVVHFYDALFSAHLTPQEHDDLVAFLRAL
jgi:cytochrome c peroxidase